MAILKLYKKVLAKDADGGVEIKVCTADLRQVEAMKKNGWCETEVDADKVTKAALEKAAKVEKED
jgi:hypothetical protein